MHPDTQRLAKYHSERNKRYGAQMIKLKNNWQDYLLVAEFIVCCLMVVWAVIIVG